MHQMIELHPAADALDVLGLPAIPYPVALPVFQAAVANDGELPLADMLHGLQLRAAHGADWERLQPAMARLSELIAGDDARQLVVTSGAGWQLEVGPVRTAGATVTMHRGGQLLAAMADRGDGGLRLATYRPLDGAAIALVLHLAGNGESPGSGAWPRTLAAAQASRSADEAVPFLVARPAGAGVPGAAGWADDAAADPAPVARPPACVAAELATWDALRAQA